MVAVVCFERLRLRRRRCRWYCRHCHCCQRCCRCCYLPAAATTTTTNFGASERSSLHCCGAFCHQSSYRTACGLALNTCYFHCHCQSQTRRWSRRSAREHLASCSRARIVPVRRLLARMTLGRREPVMMAAHQRRMGRSLLVASLLMHHTVARSCDIDQHC